MFEKYLKLIFFLKISIIFLLEKFLPFSKDKLSFTIKSILEEFNLKNSEKISISLGQEIINQFIYLHF